MLAKDFLSVIIVTFALLFSTTAQTNDRTAKQVVDENVVLDELTNTTDTPIPYHIRKAFPYYVSGFDDENRPIIVVEFGRWDIRSVVEKGGQDLIDFKRYIEEGFKNFVDVQKMRRTEENEVDGTVIICDLEGYNLLQMAHVPTLQFVMGLTRKLREIQKQLAYAVVINTNYVGQQAISLGRPILGSALEKFEFYGTTESKWKPVLVKKFGAANLPPWYGGNSKNYTPVAVFG